MISSSVRGRRRRRGTATAGALVAAAVLAGCGSHTTPAAAPAVGTTTGTPAAEGAAPAPADPSPAAGGVTATVGGDSTAPTEPATGSTGLGAGATVTTPTATPTATTLPTLRAVGTATPPPPRKPTGTTDSAENHSAQELISDTYDSWMTDLSGLYDNLSQPWLDAIGEIATPTMKQAAYGSANAVEQANEHGVGELVDSHRVISIEGSKTVATISDCLDELHWYVVNNKTGKPDPGVTRGYYEGDAKLALENGQWYVSAWNSHPTACTP